MNEKELEKIPKSDLIYIITSELDALNGLISNQQTKINQLNNTPNRDLTNFLIENERLGGYTVARDMLLRFINEHIEKKE